MIKQNKAFTLVELIVVITIIAILWTIAFISLQWYSQSARDSTRVSDIQNIKTSLELFQTEAWKYPDTTWWTQVTYLWAEVWTQWTFWEQTFTNVWKLNKIPTDPLVNREYTYSVLNTKNEYQLWAIYESDNLAGNIDNEILNTTYAWDNKAIWMITWNYNWILAKVSTWSTLYTLGVPSIINSDLTNTNLIDIITNNHLSYDWFNNLPASYEWTIFNTLSSEPLVLVNPSNLVIYSWSIENLSTWTGQIEFIENMQLSYTWTIIAWLNEIWTILDLDTINDIEWTQLVAQVLIQQFLNSNIEITGVVSSWEWEEETPAVQLLQANQVSAWGSHTCALTTAWWVKCWGSNSYWQLWDWTTTERLLPTDVIWLTSWVSNISLWGNYTCALTIAWWVKCWGNNSYWQLWDWTSWTNRLTPIDVSWLTSWISSISALGYHTCALTIAWWVKCWWRNNHWQLWDWTSWTDWLNPVNVSWLTSWISSISAWGYHTCALSITWWVKCWGYNTYWQIWDWTSWINKLIPVNVSWLTSWVSNISLWGYHSCALLTTWWVKCWWYNFNWEIWDWTEDTHRLIPVNVSWLTSWVSNISLWGYHSCALLTTWWLKCWGKNNYWQIWDNTIIQKLIPTSVNWLTSWVSSISLWNNHSCALLSTWWVKCWWYNSSWQIWDWTEDTNRLTPVDVTWLNNVSKVYWWANKTCVEQNDWTIQCWWYNWYWVFQDGYDHFLKRDVELGE